MKLKTTLLTLALTATGSLTANAQLVINEMMQSNVECIIDDLNEFPDSWVELYNSGTEAVNLKDYKVSNKNKQKKAWQLPDMTVEPQKHVIVYCDKEGKEDNRLHTDFRLESDKGCTLYLFKGGVDEPVDSLPYIDDKPLPKMPAPDVAFGRKTDGATEWGYQLTPTPGEANTGEICKAKKILGAPVFSEQGRVTSEDTAISLELSLPEGSPEDAFITYTTNGSEPTAQDTKYTTPININKTTAIRAKVFCEGWLSPMSTAQSYIFHPREMTLPIFSVQTDDRYLNSAELGLFYNNNSKEDKKTHDWRRPVNIEFFPAENQESLFNQLGETRIQGGQSRANALKSMVFYANKRFDPDHKRFSYEFFPDQKPGIKEFKSFSLRDGGNDFSDLYFRDLIIQRTMASHVDLDWQAGHSAVLYINGEYMGMLNIRERSNEDNIYSNYNGLEDLDMVEIGHEQVGGKDMFIEELKEGDEVFYNAFKEFYSEKGHIKAEYEQWMDVSEYLDVMVMNLFYGNIDFPGNNLVFWRPNDDDTESGLPKIWRVIVKDTDFGLGLYGRSNDVNTIDMIYHPENHQGDAWACTEPATRLFRNMMEDPELRQMFIDKCCVYMGDFMNAEGTGAIIDLIKDEAMEEFVAHRDKYNAGGWWGPVDNRADIETKFENAKKWLAGYTEDSWWGTTTYQSRPDNFLSHLNDQYNLGDAVPVVINKDVTDLENIEVSVNGIKLSEGTFDGKFFTGMKITFDWVATEDASTDYIGWSVTITPKNGAATNEFIEGASYSFTIPENCKKVEIKLSTGLPGETGVNSQKKKQQNAWRIVGTQLIISDIECGTDISLYDVSGRIIYQGKANDHQVFIPLGYGNGSYILKTGNKIQKIG